MELKAITRKARLREKTSIQMKRYLDALGLKESEYRILQESVGRDDLEGSYMETDFAPTHPDVEKAVLIKVWDMSDRFEITETPVPLSTGESEDRREKRKSSGRPARVFYLYWAQNSGTSADLTPYFIVEHDYIGRGPFVVDRADSEEQAERKVLARARGYTDNPVPSDRPEGLAQKSIEGHTFKRFSRQVYVLRVEE